MTEKIVVTTELFWDCECKTNYIHAKTERACLLCATRSATQPDSRVIEVLEAGLALDTLTN